MIFKKPKREINKVYIHCSASDVKAHDNIETIRGWHIAKGWSDVGYHYFIRKDGTLEEGRPLTKQPAAQGRYKGVYYNKGSIAICLSGLDKELFTQSQFDTLISLCEEINKSYYKITFHGHSEVSDKTCPVFDYKEVLNLDDRGLMPLNSSYVFLEGQELIKPVSITSTPPLSIQPRKKMSIKTKTKVTISKIGFLQDSKGNQSSKRLGGSILIGIGIIFSSILFYYSLGSSAKDASTALGIINIFLISGGGLIGVGVFEKGIKK